jgi:hypothetical protein
VDPLIQETHRGLSRSQQLVVEDGMWAAKTGQAAEVPPTFS